MARNRDYDDGDFDPAEAQQPLSGYRTATNMTTITTDDYDDDEAYTPLQA